MPLHEHEERVQPDLLEQRGEQAGQVEAGAEAVAEHGLVGADLLPAELEACGRVDVRHARGLHGLPRGGDHRLHVAWIAALVPGQGAVARGRGQPVRRRLEQGRERARVGADERGEQLGQHAHAGPLRGREHLDGCAGAGDDTVGLPDDHLDEPGLALDLRGEERRRQVQAVQRDEALGTGGQGVEAPGQRGEERRVRGHRHGQVDEVRARAAQAERPEERDPLLLQGEADARRHLQLDTHPDLVCHPGSGSTGRG